MPSSCSFVCVSPLLHRHISFLWRLVAGSVDLILCTIAESIHVLLLRAYSMIVLVINVIRQRMTEAIIDPMSVLEPANLSSGFKIRKSCLNDPNQFYRYTLNAMI